MKLAADRTHPAMQPARFEPAIDIEHLARMRDAPAPVVAAFAHTLKGSARGIGAWRVAEAAGAVEAQAVQPDDRAAADALAQLALAVHEARALIADILDARS